MHKNDSVVIYSFPNSAILEYNRVWGGKNYFLLFLRATNVFLRLFWAAM